MLERGKAQGVKVAALAGKKAHAVRHVAAGVDLIIAQGSEAGGHTGEIGTMVLVPEIVDAVAPVPVLAAGGIGNGRQLAASLALGAEGVWCGSVWLTTEEAETHPTVKQKFLAATSSDTLRSRSRTGKPARQLRSAWTDEWESASSPGPLGMPLQPILIAEASQRIDRAAHDPKSKAAQLSNYFVGQIVGSMNQVKPAGRVVLEMVEEFIDAMQRVETMME
jgi:NAD(P)H-dependent flavin oxidoreductase YrpB (nitropropane dioxygenase family)